jgi:hypothetical protein
MTRSWSAGLVLVKVAPLPAGCHLPPIRFWYVFVTGSILSVIERGRWIGPERSPEAGSRIDRDIRPFPASSPVASIGLTTEEPSGRVLFEVTGLK